MTLIDAPNPIWDQMVNEVMPDIPETEGGGIDYSAILEACTRLGLSYPQIAYMARTMAQSDGLDIPQAQHYRHALIASKAQRRGVLPAYTASADAIALAH